MVWPASLPSHHLRQGRTASRLVSSLARRLAHGADTCLTSCCRTGTASLPLEQRAPRRAPALPSQLGVQLPLLALELRLGELKVKSGRLGLRRLLKAHLLGEHAVELLEGLCADGRLRTARSSGHRLSLALSLCLCLRLSLSVSLSGSLTLSLSGSPHYGSRIQRSMPNPTASPASLAACRPTNQRPIDLKISAVRVTSALRLTLTRVTSARQPAASTE